MYMSAGPFPNHGLIAWYSDDKLKITMWKLEHKNRRKSAI